MNERLKKQALNHLSGLHTFQCAARHLNFANAAKDLHITPTAVSKSIRQLEASLGVRLFNRTTRSVALTEAGKNLATLLEPALQEVVNVLEEVQSQKDAPAGRIKINTSYVGYVMLIEPWLNDFRARFPDIYLDFTLDSKLSDITLQGFDFGIRLGEALRQDVIALPIGSPAQRIVVASPGYVASAGEPIKPCDLMHHRCIQQRLSAQADFLPWRFSSGGSLITADINEVICFDKMKPCLDAAVNGLGLAYVFRELAEPYLRDGRLRHLLDAFNPPGEQFYLYYANRNNTPRKLRCFIDFMSQKSSALRSNLQPHG